MYLIRLFIATVSIACVTVTAALGLETEIDLVRLSGSTGPQGTAIFRADLSVLGSLEIRSITIHDSNSMVGGSPGAYSGFDLDAIRISEASASSATEAVSLTGLDVFDFSDAGTFFSPGTQRSPEDFKLHGTDSTGNAIDHSFATLHQFDAQFFLPGSVSLGDGGAVAINLTTPINTAGNMYLYIGEVSGDPGETLASRVVVSEEPFLPGDFDKDRDVDGADFLVWQREGRSSAELAFWESNFGTHADSSAVALHTIPEPMSVALMISCSVCMMSNRLRLRK